MLIYTSFFFSNGFIGNERKSPRETSVPSPLPYPTLPCIIFTLDSLRIKWRIPGRPQWIHWAWKEESTGDICTISPSLPYPEFFFRMGFIRHDRKSPWETFVPYPMGVWSFILAPQIAWKMAKSPFLHGAYSVHIAWIMAKIPFYGAYVKTGF